MIVYLNGRFMPGESAMISPEDRGFVFGDGVYEVIRAYAGRLFAAGPHLDRLNRSLRELRIHFPDTGDLLPVAEKLIRENGLETGDATVYIQITRGVAPRKHAFPGPDTLATVYAAASPFAPPDEAWSEGARVITLPDIRWSRCDIKTISLQSNVLAAQRAAESGAREAVFIRNGAVTEGSHTNFCGVLDGEIRTAPANNLILPGITRSAVMELCARLGLTIREFPVLEHEIPRLSEAMLLGTTTEVMPVIAIDGAPVGDGRPGPITRRLQKAFAEYARA